MASGEKQVTKDLFRNGDLIAGAALAALGAYIVIESHGYSYLGESGPGPGFFPTWYGIAMMVFSLLLILTSVKSKPSAPIDWPGIGRAAATWAAFAASAALMDWIGFFASFTLLTFFVIFMIFRQPFATAAIAAILTSAGFYLVFPLALGVELPVGVFGF